MNDGFLFLCNVMALVTLNHKAVKKTLLPSRKANETWAVEDGLLIFQFPVKQFNSNDIQGNKSDCKNRIVLIDKQRSDNYTNEHNAMNQKH